MINRNWTGESETIRRKIPLLDLQAQHEPIRAEILEAITRVLDSNSFILGPEVETFEKRVAQYCGAEFAVGVSSGTDALLVALMALDIGPGAEVITTPYSFFATAGCIARVGAKPVFADIEPRTFNIDPNRIEAAITSKTRAILPVHLFGQCAEMAPILDIAQRYGLDVIEDAAQAIGAQYRDGRRAGSMGRVGCFSFFPSKNLGAMGDAGLVVTDSADVAEKLRIMRSHGGKPKYHHQFIGGNFRLDAIQAAILNVKLNYLETWTRRRQENASRYEQLFRETDALPSPVLSLPIAEYRQSNVPNDHIYNQFVIRTTQRNRLRESLERQGILTEVYYPIPCHRQNCFAYLGHQRGAFSQSEKAADESLALPIYPELSQESQHIVVDAIVREILTFQ